MDQYLIIGSGASALGSARILRHRNLSVTVSDLREISDQTRKTFEDLGCTIVIGPQSSDLISRFNVIVLSPGIPLDSLVAKEAQQLKKQLISEIDLALHDFKGREVAVTGTNGKSTVVTLFEHLAKNSGLDCVACGNLGKTPSEVMLSEQIPNILALELSSYQLELSEKIRSKVSIFTSFSPDHLERHKTLENYLRAKWRLAHQTQSDGLLIMSSSFYEAIQKYGLKMPNGRRVTVVCDKATQPAPNVNFVYYDKSKVRIELEGTMLDLNPHFSHHDNINLAACIIALKFMEPELDFRKLISSSMTYNKLPHRFETIGTFRGCQIINDSKSTNLESTLVGLNSMKDSCYLLLGGQGKGERYRELINLDDKIELSFCFGASGQEIYNDIKDKVRSKVFPALGDAILDLSREFQKNPKPILFSPACASFDEFLNFEERGLYFSKEITALLE